MLAQVRNLTACVIGVVLFVVSAGHAFDETALAKAKEAARIGAVFVCESCALQGETGWRGPLQGEPAERETGRRSARYGTPVQDHLAGWFNCQ